MVAYEAPNERALRLICHRQGGRDVLAIVLSDGTVTDAADLGADLPVTMQGLIDGGVEVLDRVRAAVEGGGGDAPRCALADLHLAPPVGRVGKLIAVGKNYHDHAAEEGVLAPREPLLFAKFPSAMVGEGADIEWRATDTTQVDWEGELAVVIGRTTRDVAPEVALTSVLGYTCLNDISARDLQFGDGQWVRGKSLDTFCPIGPSLVTADEIPDPQLLGIRTLVNGEIMQEARTSQMIHSVATLIAFCSRFMTLQPGDIIATGTPGGVGVFRDPPRFLAHGDEVIVEIDGIGRLRNHCRVVP